MVLLTKNIFLEGDKANDGDYSFMCEFPLFLYFTSLYYTTKSNLIVSLKLFLLKDKIFVHQHKMMEKPYKTSQIKYSEEQN